MATPGVGVLARRPPARWRASRVAVLGLLALLVAGCGLARGTISTVQALDKAGFGSPSILPRANDTLEVSVRKDTEDLDAAAVEAAGLVWRESPLRIERLEVTCGNGFGGKGRFAADRAELEQRFGPRDAALDRGIQDRDLRLAGLVLLGLLLVGIAVLAGIVILVVVLIRRNRTPKPPGPAGPWPPPPWPGSG